MTPAAFAEAACSIDDGFQSPARQSPNGRLWDVLTVPRFAIRAAHRRGDTDRVHLQVTVDDGPGTALLGQRELNGLQGLYSPKDTADGEAPTEAQEAVGRLELIATYLLP